MLKKVILILLLSPLFTVGQTNLDSLWSVWKDQSQQDSIRLKAINTFIWKEYIFSKPDSALILAQLQYDFAKKNKIETNMTSALNIQGIVYSMKGKYKESIYYYNKALKIARELGISKRIAGILNNLGGVYLQQGDLPSSIDCFNKSLKLYEKIDEKHGQALCLSNIGNIYYSQEDYDRSLESYNKSLKLHKENKTQKEIASTYSKIGNILIEKKSWDEALKYYEMAYNIIEGSDNQYEIADILSRIGLVYNGKKQYEKSLKYQFKSFENQQALGFNEDLSYTQLEIARLFHQLGKKDSALFYGSKALAGSQKMKITSLIEESSEFLYKYFKAQGDKNQALKMIEINIVAKDKNRNENNEKAIMQFKFQSDFEKLILKEELKYEELKKETKFKAQKERYLTGLGILILVIVLGIILRSRYITNLNNRNELLHKIEILKERGISNMVTNGNERKEMALNRDRLEQHIDGNLNMSDWKILNVLFKEPLITNKEIAEQVNLSLEGTSSALRKMYKMLQISDAKNKKLALITEVTRISAQHP
tara:strand:- start:3431 stop:5044 length:1614 start_codon:yes stop_codon:yes gene_type:complete